ncbi:hypothetical protein BZL30_7401 [Mycobacterium kansasii]|uniref:Uncharacterized protein n=1 Tax=Mycobacterium kansasii TaxID=1768 RepID=A0A1V3WR91_MYCKA|nr:hypothetical protein BZL30_7401 [Mycobacterium kansasii]
MEQVDDELLSAVAPRWQGKAGRLEVWYATLSDPSTRAGLWVHCETVAPTTGSPYGHGWVTWFPPEARRAPNVSVRRRSSPPPARHGSTPPAPGWRPES